MDTLDWICRVCSKNCHIQTDSHIKPYKCVYFELSMPDWKQVKELSLYQKMEKVMRLYPGHTWKADMRMSRNEGGDTVPEISVGFGQVLPDEDWPSFSPIVIDRNGELLGLECTFTTIPEDAYEAFRTYLETDIEYILKEICDEILKRNETKDE